jgi:hypothetical protein
MNQPPSAAPPADPPMRRSATSVCPRRRRATLPQRCSRSYPMPEKVNLSPDIPIRGRQIVLHQQAGSPETGNDAVHSAGVQGEDDAREQVVRSGDGDHLLPAPPSVLRYLPAVDCALELMHRFASAQQYQELAEVGERQMVVRKQCSQQTSQVISRTMKWIADGGRSQPIVCVYRGHLPSANGRHHKSHEIIPTALDGLQRHPTHGGPQRHSRACVVQV